MTRGWLHAGLAFAALLAIGVVWNQVAPEPKGPPSSSYATTPAGAAAWAELLDRRGRTVRRIREDVADADLDPRTTVVLLDPGPLARADRRALARFVRAGGRLVAAGAGAAGAAGELLGSPPRATTRGAGRIAAPVAPVAEAPAPVRTAGRARWRTAGEALPALGGLLVLARPGRGTVALLADASPLQNRLLARDGNAAMALALAPAGRPVAFVESVHGYGSQRGLAALPGRWKAVLAGLVLAALVLLAAHARRLGPPELPDVPPAPPRGRYVEALGGTLGRTDDAAAVADPLRRAARDLVLARAGLPGDAQAAEVSAAAARLGLDEDEARVVAGGASDAHDMVVAGRALAHLRRGGT